MLQGAKNPAGAQQVIDFLLSPEFQASVPDGMYVYPVDAAAPLPAAWQQYAPVATDPADPGPGRHRGEPGRLDLRLVRPAGGLSEPW